MANLRKVLGAQGWLATLIEMIVSAVW